MEGSQETLFCFEAVTIRSYASFEETGAANLY